MWVLQNQGNLDLMFVILIYIKHSAFLTAAAAPSRYPPMKICSVSGLEGKYFDRARKARYASAKEYRTLQDIPTAALKAHKGQI